MDNCYEDIHEWDAFVQKVGGGGEGMGERVNSDLVPLIQGLLCQELLESCLYDHILTYTVSSRYVAPNTC